MAIKVTLAVEPATAPDVASRKVTLQHVPDAGGTADPDITQDFPVTATSVSVLAKKGQTYDSFFTSKDNAGNESAGVNKTRFTAIDTKAPDPDAAPTISSMDEVPDVP